LKARALAPDQLLSSPARRAFKTAKLIASAIGFPVDGIRIDPRIYLANTGVLLHLIQQFPDRSNQVVMFGHNPGFTDLVNVLTDAGLGNVPTCGVASIEFAVESWAAVSPGAGRLGFFDYPKRHRIQDL
jgi:phosphohistidine phosphatase